jgi:hypothetical protein
MGQGALFSRYRAASDQWKDHHGKYAKQNNDDQNLNKREGSFFSHHITCPFC